MILSSESFAKPVFHLIKDGHWAAVLESFPHPTPVFQIQRLPTDEEPIWRVNATYEIGFTENMLCRTDVLEYMVQAQQFVDTSNKSTVLDTVSRLLVHWAKLFPRGVPDIAF